MKIDRILKQCAVVLFLVISISNMNAQCDMNRHNTSWNDAWISCEVKDSPNPIREAGHWILYNFGKDYELEGSHMWNLNDPESLGSGINEYIVDYSVDGVQWESMGTFDLSEANGTSVYSGTSGPDFDMTIAQYILITAVSNHGGDCYGLSEMKFEINEDYVSGIIDTRNYNYCFTARLEPNVTLENTKLLLQSNCGGELSYRILNAQGASVTNLKKIKVYNNEIVLPIESNDFKPGVYFIECSAQGQKKTLKLVKM